MARGRGQGRSAPAKRGPHPDRCAAFSVRQLPHHIPSESATFLIWTPWTSAAPPLMAAATCTASGELLDVTALLQGVLGVGVDAVGALERVGHGEGDQALLARGERSVLEDAPVPVEELLPHLRGVLGDPGEVGEVTGLVVVGHGVERAPGRRARRKQRPMTSPPPRPQEPRKPWSSRERASMEGATTGATASHRSRTSSRPSLPGRREGASPSRRRSRSRRRWT